MTIHALPALPTPRSVELMPGDVALGLAGDFFKTLLGSCVAIILTDSRGTVGAMCHIVHASNPPRGDARNTAFGSVAMTTMFDMLGSIGIVPSLCHAYVYGGGNMFPGLIRSDTVGERNVQWALDFLASHGITVIDHCLLGVGHRTVSWTVGLQQPQVALVPLDME